MNDTNKVAELKTAGLA